MSSLDPPIPAAAGKKIIIVGAGIAGLSLALSLRKQWPDAANPPSLTIYERESKEAILGREGYSLSIRGDALSGGMQVLQHLDILERMLPSSLSARSGRNGSFNLWSTDWESLLDVPVVSSEDGTPTATGMRIARAVLRRAMIDAVGDADDEIVWDKPCSNVEALPGGRVRMDLADGAVDECDILVVADGASSRIRQQARPEDSLRFTGVVCIAGTASFPEGEEVPEPVDADWGGVLGGGGVGLFVSPVDRNRALWSVSYFSDAPRERLRYPLSDHQEQAVLDEAIERGRHFNEPFQTMVRATDPTTLMVFNAMDKEPFGHKETARGIVFIGDANHAVSPFAGNGANMALLDGWELAGQLATGRTVDEAVEAYDGKSIPRSTATVRQSHWAISTLHATGLKLFVYRVLFKLVGVYRRWRG